MEPAIRTLLNGALTWAIISSAGCGQSEPAQCPEATSPSPTATAAPTCPPCPQAQATPATQSKQGSTTTTLSGPVDANIAKIALTVWNDLTAQRYAQVTTRLEPGLASDLTPKRLKEIMDGVKRAHGAATVVDAWETTVREEGQQLPAASVLLRMTKSKTRFRLLLVFNPDSSIRGFWFRPI